MARILALKVGRALIGRLLFALHSLVTIWRLYMATKQPYYWAFAASPLLLFAEAAVTIFLRHGDEYKWFCPSVFIFLCGSVPPVWLLELNMTYEAIRNTSLIASAAGRTKTATMSTRSRPSSYRTTFPTTTIAASKPVMSPHEFLETIMNLPDHYWLQGIEQSLLIVLILGRWLLPKGRLTRDELSQLLLAYLAISSDIVELFNLFNETEVRTNVNYSFIVLALWSVSLIQFPLVITTVKAQKARYCFTSSNSNNGAVDTYAYANDVGPSPYKHKISESGEHPPLSPLSYLDNSKRQDDTRSSTVKKLTDVRSWGILSTVLLQDLPFWIMRVYLIAWEQIMSYTMLFFVCKNSLIIWIQLYRLIIICTEKPSQSQTQTPKSKSSVHMLHPQLYSPYASPEKMRLLETQSGANLGDGDSNDLLLKVTQVDECKSVQRSPLRHQQKPHQNGYVHETNFGDYGTSTSPGRHSDLEKRRRSSLNITKTVNARDVISRQQKAKEAKGSKNAKEGQAERPKKPVKLTLKKKDHPKELGSPKPKLVHADDL